MPQSLSNVLIHVVYSTKHRTPWLKDGGVRRKLFAYKATVLKNAVDSPALIGGGAEDHVHVLCLLSRKHPVMEVVQKAKTETSK